MVTTMEELETHQRTIYEKLGFSVESRNRQGRWGGRGGSMVRKKDG